MSAQSHDPLTICFVMLVINSRLYAMCTVLVITVLKILFLIMHDSLAVG